MRTDADQPVLVLHCSIHDERLLSTAGTTQGLIATPHKQKGQRQRHPLPLSPLPARLGLRPPLAPSVFPDGKLSRGLSGRGLSA